jgi:hypothetical protein
MVTELCRRFMGGMPYLVIIKNKNMKHILILFIVIVLNKQLFAQHTAGEQIADKIAQKMKDTLSLSKSQKTQIYNINMQLNNSKSVARQTNTNIDTISIKIQKIENTRDSFYRLILSNKQYDLYRQKKRNLIKNN